MPPLLAETGSSDDVFAPKARRGQAPSSSAAKATKAKASKARSEAAARRQAKQDKAARKEERQRRRKDKEDKKALREAKKAAKAAGEGGGEGGDADGDADASAAESEASADEEDAPTSDSGDEEGAAMDEEEASGDEAPRRKGTKASSKAKPSKGKGAKDNGKAEARPEAMDAVSSEIAIMKTLEAGPSEADLRRRRLVTIDEDERHDLVDKLNQAAAAVLARAQRSSVEQECRQLRDIKAWINARRGEEGEEADRIRADLEDALNRRTDLLEDR